MYLLNKYSIFSWSLQREETTRDVGEHGESL